MKQAKLMAKDGGDGDHKRVVCGSVVPQRPHRGECGARSKPCVSYIVGN